LSLTYDDNGNLITGDGKYREYDGFNHLIRVRNGSAVTANLLANYTWHPTEDRVLVKSVYQDGVWNETVYYVSESFVIQLIGRFIYMLHICGIYGTSNDTN